MKTPKHRFKIGGVPEHFNLPWRMAIEENLFSDLDTSIHWADMTGGTGQMIKGLQMGSIDVAVLLTEGVSKAILQGLPAKIMDIYVQSPLQWGIHTSHSSKHSSLSEFKDPSFAISRTGSGSHLMAYVLGMQQAWNMDHVKFNVIGDVYGGIWALEQQEADLFLWEKYTTQPFVSKRSCRRIGQINSPWPCFVIAVRNEVFYENEALIREIISIVQKKAADIKSHPKAIDWFSWRYNIRTEDIKIWLNETEWKSNSDAEHQAIKPVIDFLLQSNLVNPHEAENWEQKLF